MTRLHPFTLLIIAAFLAVLPTALIAADDGDVRRVNSPLYVQKNDQMRIYPAGKPECTCRAGGRSFGVGTTTCLGAALFRCEMDQNVTSWKPTKEACPLS